MQLSTILSVLAAFTATATAQQHYNHMDARDFDNGVQLAARAAHAQAFADAYDEALAHYRRAIPASKIFARNSLQCQGQPGLFTGGRCMVNTKAQGKKMDCGSHRGEKAQCTGKGPADAKWEVEKKAMEEQAGSFKVGSKGSKGSNGK